MRQVHKDQYLFLKVTNQPMRYSPSQMIVLESKMYHIYPQPKILAYWGQALYHYSWPQV